MMKLNKKVKTGIIATVVTIIVLVILVIAFISPITKYMVEKYSVKYTGRQIKMSWVYVNPFTGYVHISKLKIYEQKSDTIFFSSDGVSADMNMHKLFSKTYEIGSITLDKPWGRIIQNRRALNFNDLIEKFTPKGPSDSTKPPTKVNILNIKIKDGEFHYIEQVVPIDYYVKAVNIESPGKWWNIDSMNMKVSLVSGPSTGDIKANGMINFKTLDYKLAAVVNKFDLGLIEQYLHDLSNYGSFSANLDANIKVAGNFKNQLDMKSSGLLAVNDFHFGKVKGEDYASFDKLVLDIIEVNPSKFKYLIDSVMLLHPFVTYERYDYLDNIQRMFGKGGEKVMAAKADSAKFNLIIKIADYINVLTKNFLQSYYKVNRVALYNGDIKFTDYALREKFSVDADPLYIVADSLDKNHDRLKVALKTGVKPYGNIAVELSINPNDVGYFDVDYKLMKVPLSMLNPYLLTYTSFPMDRGTLDFEGVFHTKAGDINSENHLLMLDPRLAKRVKKGDTKWLPMPLIMFFARNPGNAIDFEIPIRGNLKNPKFKFWGVVGEVVKNIFVKPPSTPYLFHAKMVEKKMEKYLTLKWATRQIELRPLQQKFVSRMADFLKKNEGASISVHQMEYSDKEKEYILFFAAKKKYYLNTYKQDALSEDDSIAVDKMSVKDTAFLHYLDMHIKDTMMFTVQEKCLKLVGEKAVNAYYSQLLKARQDVFMSYFKANGTEDKVKLLKGENVIPFNGFSFYKVDYIGEMPETLVKAHEEMMEINDKSPRKKYQDERKKRVRGIFKVKEVK